VRRCERLAGRKSALGSVGQTPTPDEHICAVVLLYDEMMPGERLPCSLDCSGLRDWSCDVAGVNIIGPRDSRPFFLGGAL
jgi:hypothetical protein